MTARLEMKSSESEAPLIGDMVKAVREGIQLEDSILSEQAC